VLFWQRVTPSPVFKNTPLLSQAKHLVVLIFCIISILPDWRVLTESPLLDSSWIVFPPPSFLSPPPTQS
jgi:hypothetical protein